MEQVVAAATDAATGATVPELLRVLIAILVSAKILGELGERIGQPAVLGELVAGVLLGGSVLGVVNPEDPILHLLAEIGIVVLLFEIGLETSLGELLKVGGASVTTAMVGVVVPFALGWAISDALGLGGLAPVVIGAALTATSVGITARVLSDLGRLQDPEAKIILGAAVIDDVVGLVILGIVAGLVRGEAVTASGIVRIAAVAFGFLIGALVLGRIVVPPTFRFLGRIGREETLAIMALALAFLSAYLADLAGSALIIGAFAAGLILQPTPEARVVEEGVARLGHFFVPIFFVTVGAAVDVTTFADRGVLLAGVALIVVAIAGKFVAGYAPIWFRGRKAVIGAGMIPRGEVGLIFAQLGRTEGVLTAGQFSALMLVVMVTTFVAPPLLKALLPPARGVPGPPPRGVADLTTEV